jgi:hypothetical protein
MEYFSFAFSVKGRTNSMRTVVDVKEEGEGFEKYF